MFFSKRWAHFSLLAMIYRGIDLRELQAVSGNRDRDIRDAKIGAMTLLADHAALEGDWKASMIYVR